MATCPPTVPKGLAYKCLDGLGVVTGVDPETTTAGIPLVQKPLEFCGSQDLVCDDNSVSGCISDSDGAPTAYGPAPTTPASGAGNNSPKISRLRVRRDDEAVFPYSAVTAHKPDQLIDITTNAGTPIDFNPATGVFKLPANGSGPVAGCGLTDTDGVWTVDDDYNMASGADSEFGSVVVISPIHGRVLRLTVDQQIENISCRPQHVHTATFAGFGITPVSGTAQVQFGIYNNTQAAVLQISQSMNFDAGWQQKHTYLYPALMSTLAVSAFQGDSLCLFIQVISGDVIWVDADFSVSYWYGK